MVRTMRILRRLTRGSYAVLAILACSASAAAQERTWEFELRTGGLLSASPAGGEGALPPAGQTFEGSGGTSRKVASWFFGDGARFLNDFLQLRGVATRVVPLDALLVGQLFERRSGVQLGARLSKAVSRRVEVEVTVDVSNGGAAIKEGAASQIEATRGSFVGAWNAVFADGSVVFATPQTSATATIREGGREVLTMAGLNLNLVARGKVVPYVAAGAGVLTRVGGGPSAVLVGNYTFLASGLFSMDETDTLLLDSAAEKHLLIGLAGGGIKYFATPNRGVRLDVRAHLWDPANHTILSAAPNTKVNPPVQTVVFSRTTPSLQISNNPDNPSTLSTSIAEFESFSGPRTLPLRVTLGYFWRF